MINAVHMTTKEVSSKNRTGLQGTWIARTIQRKIQVFLNPKYLFQVQARTQTLNNSRKEVLTLQSSNRTENVKLSHKAS